MSWAQRAKNTITPRDSRDYAFAYVLWSRSDFPEDFLVPEVTEDFTLGLFLPMDQPSPDSFWQMPARILLLHGDRLTLAFHPNENVRYAAIPLSSIVMLEFGRLLMKSWVRIISPNGTWFLPHHTRDHEDAQPFFAQLRGMLVPDKSGDISSVPSAFGVASDRKVLHAERDALAGHGSVQLRFSSPAVLRREERRWMLSEGWIPAQYLGVTSKFLVWITDGMGGARDPYGTVTRYGSLAALRETRFTNGEEEAVLRFEFSGSEPWTIGVPCEHADAALAFLDAFHDCGLWQEQVRSRGHA